MEAINTSYEKYSTQFVHLCMWHITNQADYQSVYFILYSPTAESLGALKTAWSSPLTMAWMLIIYHLATPRILTVRRHVWAGSRWGLWVLSSVTLQQLWNTRQPARHNRPLFFSEHTHTLDGVDVWITHNDRCECLWDSFICHRGSVMNT